MVNVTDLVLQFELDNLRHRVTALEEHDKAQDQTTRILIGVLSKQQEDIARLGWVTRKQQKEIDHLRTLVHAIIRYLRHNHPQTTFHVVNQFSGENMADNVLQFSAVGQTSTDTLTPRLADGVTPSGGVVSNVAVNFSDPSATAVVQPDNTVLFTSVAPTTSPVSGSTSCTVTDTDGAVSTWTIPFTVEVAAPPPPDQLTQSVANVFSTPA